MTFTLYLPRLSTNAAEKCNWAFIFTFSKIHIELFVILSQRCLLLYLVQWSLAHSGTVSFCLFLGYARNSELKKFRSFKSIFGRLKLSKIMFDRFWLANDKNLAGLNLQPISGSTNGNLSFLAPEPVFLDVMENPKCFRRATAQHGNLFQGMRVFWGLFGSFGLIFVPLTSPTRPAHFLALSSNAWNVLWL